MEKNLDTKNRGADTSSDEAKVKTGAKAAAKKAETEEAAEIDLREIADEYFSRKENKAVKLIYITSDGTVFPGDSEGKNNAAYHQVRELKLESAKIGEFKKD